MILQIFRWTTIITLILHDIVPNCIQMALGEKHCAKINYILFATQVCFAHVFVDFFRWFFCVFFVLLFEGVNYTNTNGSDNTFTVHVTDDTYIGVYVNDTSISINENYNTSAGYNFYRAKDYCMNEFGSSLASLHSENDLVTVANLTYKIVTSFIGYDYNYNYYQRSIWIGLRGSSNSNRWTDGSRFDYGVSGCPNPGDISADQCCVGSLVNETNLVFSYNDCGEIKLFYFICNKAQYWRPIFKISNNNSDYGQASNTYEYWINGNTNFDTYSDDINFIRSDKNITRMADINYRSLIIDDLSYFYSNSLFSQIKVSLFKDEKEIVYFVYNATNDTVSWYSRSNIIDSSYVDTGLSYYTDSEYVNEFWDIDSGFQFSGDDINWGCSVTTNLKAGCKIDAWMYVIVAHNFQHEFECVPSVYPQQKNNTPQIRYSIYQTIDSNGELQYGYYRGEETLLFSNDIAESMIVYINSNVTAQKIDNINDILPLNTRNDELLSQLSQAGMFQRV